jgi:CubicO group peptidase (beta-lactamase class C family)
MRLVVFSALLLLAACAGSDSRSGIPAARVDSLFGDIRPDAPGCAVGVYRAGEPVLVKGYGMASLEEGRPITSATTFNLGSASKPFTALATLMLEERHKLSLDDEVRRYLPELSDSDTPIRIRDLLQHTSGLRDYGSLSELLGREIATTPEFLRQMSSNRLNFTPGTQHEYSHSDFELLGLVVERVAGEPFGTFLEREVLAPLGMTGSRVHDSRGAGIPERASGYEKSGEVYRLKVSDSELTGGSNLYASVDDLRHWDRALDEAASGQRTLVARMLQRPTLPNGDTIPYAFGIRKGSYRGLPTVSRGGHVAGMRAELIRFPGKRLTVVTLCNGEHLYAGLLAQRVADLYLGDSAEPRRERPRIPPPVPIAVTELQRYVGFYRSAEAFDLGRIAIVDGKLVELMGDTAQTMTHLGGGEFFGDGSPGDFRLRFTQPAGGPLRLEYVSDGQVVSSSERIPDSDGWRPDPSELSVYAGTYSSEELGVVWRLSERDGRLELRRPEGPELALLPNRRDVFIRHFGFWAEPLVARFEFGRDAAGRITHFTITTPPGEDVVRELRFVGVALTTRRPRPTP